MNEDANEALFYKRLEVFSTERREDILRNLRHHHEEYANLHGEFGQLYIKMMDCPPLLRHFFLGL